MNKINFELKHLHNIHNIIIKVLGLEMTFFKKCLYITKHIFIDYRKLDYRNTL